MRVLKYHWIVQFKMVSSTLCQFHLIKFFKSKWTWKWMLHWKVNMRMLENWRHLWSSVPLVTALGHWLCAQLCAGCFACLSSFNWHFIGEETETYRSRITYWNSYSTSCAWQQSWVLLSPIPGSASFSTGQISRHPIPLQGQIISGPLRPTKGRSEGAM